MQVQQIDLEQAYRSETDGRVKERMLLIMLVKIDGVIAAHAAKQLHRVKSWAYKWLERYDKQGIDGLKDKHRTGSPPKISARAQMRIKKELMSNPYGWKAQEVRRLIYRRTGIMYSQTHIYRVLNRWGFRRKVPAARSIHKASKEEIEEFKKKQ